VTVLGTHLSIHSQAR